VSRQIRDDPIAWAPLGELLLETSPNFTSSTEAMQEQQSRFTGAAALEMYARFGPR
jgi:hypothetical protein